MATCWEYCILLSRGCIMINQHNFVKWRRWQVTWSGGGALSRKVQQCQCCYLDGYHVRIKLFPVPITSLSHKTVQVVLAMAVLVTLAVVAGSTSGSEVISDRYRYRPSFQTCIQSPLCWNNLGSQGIICGPWQQLPWAICQWRLAPNKAWFVM